MSIVPQQLEGIASRDEASKLLSFPSPEPKSSLERVLEELFQKLSSVEPTVIQNLDEADEEQLLVAWTAFHKIERFAWVGKCATCFRAWERTEAAKRGRGNRDVNERGILAAVSKISKKFGVTPSTVYLNARIFRLIREVELTWKKDLVGNSYTQYNILDLLDERGYWEHALTSADPIRTILVFANKKSTLPRFKVTDAERLVLSPEFSRKAVALKAVEQVRQETGHLTERQSLIEHIRTSQDIIKNLIIPSCPDESFKANIWEDLLISLEEEYDELFSEDAFVALRTAWDLGHHREDQLAETTGFPLADVSKFMRSLCDLSEFIPVQTRDRTKRSEFQLWHKVGEPFDNTLLMPMKGKE